MDVLATRRESTRDAYTRDFRLFCEWLGETPDEIIEQRKKNLESDDQKIRHRYEVKLKKYVAFLGNKGLSAATQQTRYAAVRSFFDSHYMPLKLRRSDAPSGEPIGSRIPEKAEIKKMMDLAPDLKWRALISFLKDGGWRIGDVRKLTWGDLEELEDDWWCSVRVTQKRKIKAVGFIGPDTTKLLRLYRRQRTERGEEVGGDSLVFPSRLGGPLTVGAISTRISQLAGMAEAKDVTAHSLRKYFRANLEPHLPGPWIRTMLGKKVAESTEPYTEKRPRKLLEGYKKAYNALRLEEIRRADITAQRRMAWEMLKAAGLNPDRLLIKARVKGSLTAEDEVKILTTALGRLLKREPKEERQMVIHEEELENHLNHSWTFVAALGNGKVVVAREA